MLSRTTDSVQSFVICRSPAPAQLAEYDLLRPFRVAPAPWAVAYGARYLAKNVVTSAAGHVSPARAEGRGLFRESGVHYVELLAHVG